jgi:hypothetical protein
MAPVCVLINSMLRLLRLPSDIDLSLRFFFSAARGCVSGTRIKPYVFDLTVPTVDYCSAA